MPKGDVQTSNFKLERVEEMRRKNISGCGGGAYLVIVFCGIGGLSENAYLRIKQISRKE